MDKDNLIDELKEKLNNISTEDELNILKSKYLGKDSLIISLLKELKGLNEVIRKEKGEKINLLKDKVNLLINEKREDLRRKLINLELKKSEIDITLPGDDLKRGGYHPLTKTINILEDLFISMGYEVARGPEVETILNNFTLLNIPEDHPSRDYNDTFYIDGDTLMRTQTSSVQIREMLKRKDKKPFKMICPGRTYRRDNDDATHSHSFFQLEGLVVGENITLSDLKGTLELVMKTLIGEKTQIRFRPSYFPFTEPSYEVDVSCFNCHGKGCNICKNTGWIELLGSGMVHPSVLKNAGYDPEKYRGFAFGIGIERLTMLKYNIKDIRKFYQNDLEFLENLNKFEGGQDEDI